MTNHTLAILDDSLNDLYPQGVTWDIDIPDTSLPAFLQKSIEEYGDQIGMEFLGKEISYKELGAMIDKATKGFQEIGVEKGTKVGLYMPNTPYYPVMFLAALKAGATVVNYDLSHPQAKLQAQAEDSETDIMVVTDLKDFFINTKKLLNKKIINKMVVCPMADMLTFPKNKIFPLVRPLAEIDPEDDRITNFQQITDNNGQYEPVEIKGNDLALLQYTGGTTGGEPKGAMLSHGNLIANTLQLDSFVGASKEKPDNQRLFQKGKETFLATLPLFHVYSMTLNMIGGIYFGAKIVMTPDPTDLKATMQAIRKHKPTLLPVVPKLMMGLLEHGQPLGKKLKTVFAKPTHDKADVRTTIRTALNTVFSHSGTVSKEMFTPVKNIISGGAALSPALSQKFADATGIIALQGYGLSETSPILSTQSPITKNATDTVGMPLPGTEINITEIIPDYAPDIWPQRILNVEETGEILVRGPQVMSGYYNKPEQNQSVLRDGWFRTGDVGHIDASGALKITDRNKDMIDINGKKVSSLDIMKKIEEHPAVAECAVISVPDERSGQAALAFIRFKDDGTPAPTETAMRSFFDETGMSKYEKPKHISFVTDLLPRTRVGKLYKPDLQKMADKEIEKQTGKTAPDPLKPM